MVILGIFRFSVVHFLAWKKGISVAGVDSFKISKP
jgi:hypothetical protein